MSNPETAQDCRWAYRSAARSVAPFGSALFLAALMVSSVAVAQDQTIEIEDDHGATGMTAQEQADLDSIDADLKEMHGQLVGACDIDVEAPLDEAGFKECADFPMQLKDVTFSDLDQNDDGIADSIERASYLRERATAAQ